MEYRNETDFRSEVVGVGGDGLERLGGGAEAPFSYCGPGIKSSH